jgi:hypothetical protein
MSTDDAGLIAYAIGGAEPPSGAPAPVAPPPEAPPPGVSGLACAVGVLRVILISQIASLRIADHITMSE